MSTSNDRYYIITEYFYWKFSEKKKITTSIYQPWNTLHTKFNQNTRISRLKVVRFQGIYLPTIQDRLVSLYIKINEISIVFKYFFYSWAGSRNPEPLQSGAQFIHELGEQWQ